MRRSSLSISETEKLKDLMKVWDSISTAFSETMTLPSTVKCL
jgi:hypothetical protein